MKELSGILRTRRPGHRAPGRLRCLGGGLRSWLAVRSTCTSALYLTAPLLLRLLRRQPGTRGDAGEGREAAYGARKQASPRRAGIRPKSAIRS